MNKKNDQKNGIFLFVGEDISSLKKQLRHWKKQFIEKYGDIQFDHIEIKTEKDISEVITKITSYPFLGEKKLVYIHGLPPEAKKEKGDEEAEKEEEESSSGKEAEQLIRSLGEIPEQNIVIFISEKPDKRTRMYKTIAAKAEVKEFQLLKGDQLFQWIRETLAGENRKIAPETAQFMMEYCGENMPHIHNELEKLTVATNEGDEIFKEKIVAICTPFEAENIFQFTNLIGTGNHRALLKSFQTLLRQGEAVQMVFFMIVRQLRLMIQVKYLLQKRNTASMVQSRLGLHPFQVGKLICQCERGSLSEYKKMYKAFFDLDVKIKTGRIPSTADQQEVLHLAIEAELLKMHIE